MDFFEAHERARRRSRWLVVWYAAALLAVVASYCAVAAFGYWVVTQSAMPLRSHLAIAGMVGGFIVAMSAWRMWQLSDGGPVIAHVLGARYVEPDEATREAELQALAARRGPDARAKAADLYVYVGGLARDHMLTLADLAVPAIKGERQKPRDAFLADLAAVVEADRRVTLREFVLLTFLRQRLREGAGQPIRTQFRRIEEVAADAHVMLSLVSLDQAAFQKGAAVLGLGWHAPLERARYLSPFAKPALLKACVEAAAADGVFRLPEVEMVRMVAATLDCPVPPAIAA